jgi:transposase-like protein
VMKLLSGRASVDQLAQQYGVLPATIEGWRQAALDGISKALLTDGRTERERELERENRDLKDALSRATVERALAIRAVEEWKQQSRPSRPARSRR